MAGYLRVMSKFDDSSPCVIRRGTQHDLPWVRSLILELAEFEKAGDEVTISLDTLVRDAQAGCFDVEVAELPDGTIIGMALHHARYSTWKGRTWYLEDLVVTQSWRGRGVGEQLFRAVMTRAWDEGAMRLEWQVLDWNEPALRFYAKQGASMDDSWINGRLTRLEMANTLNASSS